MKKVFFIFVLLLIVILFETALLSNIRLLPVVPDILLLVLLYISVFNGSLTGEVTGFFSGLMLDFLSAAPLGLNCLLRTLIGFIAGLFNKIVNVSGFFIPVLFGFVGTILKAIFLKCIIFFFPNGVLAYNFFSVVFATELLLNTLLAPVVFWFLSFFSSILNNSEISTSIGEKHR